MKEVKNDNLQGDRLAKLQRHIPGVVCELRKHPDGHFSIPYASDNLGDIYGLSLSDVAVDAQPWFSAIHPEDRPTVWQSLQESATHLSTWHSIHRVNQAHKQCFWVSGHGTPEHQLDGGTQWYCYLQNVTPFKKAQERSENKLRRIIDNLNEMVFIIAPDGRFTFLSSMFETIIGYPLKELLHRSFTPLLHPADLPTTIKVFQSVLAGERVQYYEYRVRHADGHYYWHSANLSPFPEDNGIVCLGVSSLINDRKQAQLALQESELRLNLALEASNIGLWDWNLQTNKVTFNANWRAMLGYGEDEIANDINEWQSRIHPEDLQAAYDDINRHLKGEVDFYRNEQRLRCKDGSYKWILDQGRVVEWDEFSNPVRFIGTHTDISDRKQTELKLQQLTEQLQKAQEVAHLGHWSWDIRSGEITWSEEVFRIFRRPLQQGEPTFEELMEQVHPEDRDMVLERVNAAGQGISQNFDYRIINSDGTIGYVNARIELEVEDEQVVEMFGTVMDITHRRVAELELERFFTISLDLLCIADTGGHFRRLSQTWSDVLGYSLADLEGKVFLEFVHPDDIPATLAAISDLKEGQSVTKFINRYRTKSGSYRHLEWFSVPQGELIYAAARDITERIEAQEQLEALLNRAQLLNALSHKVRQSLELDQIIETAIEEIFNELNLDICTFGRYGEEDGHPYVEIVQEKRKPSCKSWLEVYDATHYPKYHQALLTTNQVFTFNLQNPGEDCDQRIYEFCESMGVNLYLMLPIRTSEQLACLEMGRIDSSQEWRRDEIELLESLGLQIAIAIQQAHLYQTAQQRSAELQVAYRDLQEAQVQLVQAEKMSSLGQLVAGIAHEINNPVSFIYGNLEPLEEYVAGLLEIIQTYQETYPEPPIELRELMEDLDLSFMAEDLPKMVNSMRNGADRIRDIVKSLRTFSRLDEADLKATDLHENLDSTLMILQNQLNGRAGKPKIEVIKNYGDLPLVKCYIGLLNQVFMNLLVNAIKAIEDRQNTEVNSSYQGVITITTIPKEAGEVVISVQDNGVGMSERVKAKIFEPFFTTKPIGSGTGMGLPTSHQIVTKYHQGELYCDSKLGCGTTFFIKLPPLKSVK